MSPTPEEAESTATLAQLRLERETATGIVYLLAKVLSSADVHRISLAALRQRPSADPRLTRQLDHAVRESGIKLRGFRNPSKAPEARLAPLLYEATLRNHAVLEPLLRLWYLAASDLRKALEADLEGLGIQCGSLDINDGQMRGRWALNSFREALPWFVRKHPDYAAGDIGLMLCCLTGCVPMEDKPATTAECAGNSDQKSDTLGCRPDPTELEQLLSQLKARLSAEPPQTRVWDVLPDLLEEAAARLAAALNARQEAVDLQDALERLLSGRAEQIAFFGLGGLIGQVDVAALSARGLRGLYQTVQELEGLLDSYATLHSLSAPHSLPEARDRRRQCEEIENRVAELGRHIELALAAESSEHSDSAANPAGAGVTLNADDPRQASGLTKPRQHDTHWAPECDGDTESQLEPGSASEDAGHEAPLSDSTEERDGLPSMRIGGSDTDRAPLPEQSTAGPQALATSVKEPPLEPHPALADRRDAAGHHPLPSSRNQVEQAAEAGGAADGQREDDWVAFCVRLVSEGDLTGAIWLTRALSSTRNDLPFPDWLLAAAQAGLWLPFGGSHADSSPLTQSLVGISRDYHPAGSPASELLGLAAAVRPALYSPLSGMGAWLHTPSSCPSLHSLVERLTEFTKHAVAIRPEYVPEIAGTASLQASLAATSREAGRWLEQAPRRRVRMHRAARIWRRWVDPQGPLAEIVAAVRDDRRPAADRVRQLLADWTVDSYVRDEIERIDVTPAGRTAPITGAARDYLCSGVQQATSLADRWLSLLEEEERLERQSNWILDSTRALRSDLEAELLPSAIERLQELRGRSGAETAAASVLVRSLQCLTQDLRLGSPEPEGQADHWSWLCRPSDPLELAVCRRLLILPELSLGDDGSPQPGTLQQIPASLRAADSEHRSLPAAAKGWIDRQDFRFVPTLLESFGEDASALRQQYQDELAGARTALQQALADAEATVEQAFLDGLLASEAQRSEYLARFASVNAAQAVQFVPLHGELEGIRAGIEEARRIRITALRGRWSQLSEGLVSSYVDQELKDRVTALLGAAFDRHDLRAIQEYLDHVSAAVERGESLAALEGTHCDRGSALTELLKLVPGINEWLVSTSGQIARDVADGRRRAGLDFSQLTRERREEIVEAVGYWQQLRKSKPYQVAKRPEPILRVLAYLGFSAIGTGFTGDPRHGVDWLHVRCAISDGGLARPIPQFGSQIPVGGCDVLCVWDRLGPETVVARLNHLNLAHATVVVFFLGRLTPSQRRDLGRVSRERKLAMAVIDEPLLLFLGRERDTRLPAFLRCALPYSAVNPYTPFRAGDVPPEMFYGRDDLARRLMDPSGSCLVYGGRQLGKSALLRHVERMFHRPERQHYACVTDIKLLGDPTAGQPPDALWERLRDAFKSFGLVSERVVTSSGSDIAKYIRSAMSADDGTRVLLLFDEADNFLEADAVNGFRVVDGLRVLMAETERRIKVVFAGLHHVRRYQDTPNQPLAHYGAPILVGPLEPEAAIRLVREPLEVLGFGIDQTTALRILSYTNYHPGLIQYFCQELLDEQQHRAGRSLRELPYQIEQGQVEAIFRRPEVRERIRERFDWTLALDRRYQAIAWSMVEDQMEERDSYAQPYSSANLIDLTRDWWPQVFQAMSVTQFRGLLDELCGLGVLVQTDEGHYRLRSPNIVGLMGGEGEIEERLLELGDTEPPLPFEPAVLHRPVDTTAENYSPFTYDQESRLRQRGLHLVFGSGASGFEALPSGLRLLAPDDVAASASRLRQLPTARSAESLLAALQRQRIPDAHGSHVILYQKSVPSGVDDLRTQIEASLELCRRRPSRLSAQVFFLMGPEATAMWLAVPQATREAIEDEAASLTVLRRWSLGGIRQLLAQHGKLDLPDRCRRAQQVTGGWYSLIHELLKDCGGTDDLKDACDRLERELSDPSSAATHRLRTSLAMDAENDGTARAWSLARLLAREGQVPVDLLTPQLLADELGLDETALASAWGLLERLDCILHADGTVRLEPVLAGLLLK